MALYNTNSAPSPFGSSSATPQPDIGAQFFLGCTVIDFTVSADWESQGGQLSVNLLEDTLDTSKLDYNDALAVWSAGTTYTQKVIDPKIYDWATGSLGSLPVIGSPQHFRLLDTSNNVVFQYDGILDSISRSASPNAGKVYSVVLQSPLSLLENCSLILEQMPGFGHAKEGFPSGISQNNYYSPSGTVSSYSPFYFDTTTSPPSVDNRTLDVDLDHNFNLISSPLKLNEVFENGRPSQNVVDFTSENVGKNFGSNSRSINWVDVYNLQNIFGIYESDSHGISNYAKFGGARSVNGMRLDMIVYAIDTLINRNPSGGNAKRFGGNIISGTTTYNFERVANGAANPNPYFYGIDIYSFYDAVVSKLGGDYIYSGSVSSNLLEFISTICEDAGLDFVVELHRIQTADAGSPNYWNGTDTVSNYSCPGSLYNGGTFHLEKSFTNTTPGGIIFIKILDRRSLSLSDPQNTRTPFSKIAYQILGYEVPDYGDKGLARINPGDPNPFNSAFESGAFSATYLDPLDDDYYLKGTDGSTPYGGKFPVETKADQNALAATSQLDINNIRNDAKQTNVSIRNNQQPTARFVMGGKQSRLTVAPKKYIYQYWGEVKIFKNETGTPDPLAVADRSIPVITPILEHDDIVDFIMIDVGQYNNNESKAGNLKFLDNVAPYGIYVASVAEIRAAMSSKDNWLDFLDTFKPCVLYSILRSHGISIPDAIDNLTGLLIKPDEGTIPELTVDINNKKKLTKAFTKRLVNKGQDKKRPAKRRSQGKVNVTATLEEKDKFTVDTTIDFLHSVIADIGNTHYGKSWVAWSPQVTAKVTEDIQNYGEYIYSWNPSNSAYLEPTSFNQFKAPAHTKFMDGGRVKGYANYATKTTDGIEGSPNQDSYKATDVSYDFSEINNESKYETAFTDSSVTHIKIDVDSDYKFVPYDYFYWYDRAKKPLIKDDNGTGKIYDISYTGVAVDYPFLVANTAYSIYSNTAKSGQDVSISSLNTYTNFHESTGYSQTVVPARVDKDARINKILCSPKEFTPDSAEGVSNYALASGFYNLICPDHGVNCITFTKFTTDRVYFPVSEGEDDSTLRTMAINNLFKLLADVAGKKVVNNDADDNAESEMPLKTLLSSQYAKRIVPPELVGIPQQSNRQFYGPWFTTHNFIYGGKVEFIQDDSLVPEDLIFPVYGSLSATPNSPTFTGQLSGYAGLNLAGQSIANAIDGYGQFAAEDGSITLPGAPLISRIGDALLNGPYITELSIKVGVNGIETTYSFNSATKKAGRTNADIVRKIQNMSSVITKSKLSKSFNRKK
jgi:hypothetical protein